MYICIMSGDKYYIKDQQKIYFVTFTVVGWIDVFIRIKYKEIIVNSLNYCINEKGLQVYAWCLMSSHLHLIISAKEGFKLSDIIRDFKKFTSKEIIKTISEAGESRKEWLLNYFKNEGLKDKRISTYKFWREDNHAIVLENANVSLINQKVKYIHQNPVKEGIVSNEEDYIYSSAGDFAGRKGLVKIISL